MTADFSRGILYVATGSICRAEAEVSARSVKAVWPDVPIAIMTDAPVAAACFDRVELISDNADNLAKVRNIARSPFERTILLDSDTYCLYSFPEVFDLLDRFDVAAAHEAGRFATRWDGGTEVFIRAADVPECVPELNTGVIAFRREPEVLKLFERWLALVEEARTAALPHTQDQPSFRRAIHESDLRIAVLPAEYNFRLVIPGFARGPIKLIHGRWKYGPIGDTPEQVFATLAQTFNENEGPRVFVHAFGMICGHGPFAIAYDDPTRTCELGEIGPLAGARDEAVAARDRAIAERDQALAERDQALAERDQALAERDQTLAERDRAIAERDRAIAERDRAIAERDRAQAERDQALAERDRAQAERDQALAEAARLRDELEIMRRSTSWRITRPLRAMRRRLSPVARRWGMP